MQRGSVRLRVVVRRSLVGAQKFLFYTSMAWRYLRQSVPIHSRATTHVARSDSLASDRASVEQQADENEVVSRNDVISGLQMGVGSLVVYMVFFTYLAVTTDWATSA